MRAKSRSISEHFTLQQDNVPAHRANEMVEFCLAILPITSHRGCGHRTHQTWIRSTTKCGVCSNNACIPYPDSRRWPSEAATYRRVKSLWPENHWPSSASVACSTVWVCSSKRRPLWIQTVTNIVLRDFPMLQSWVFLVSVYNLLYLRN